MRPSKTAGSWRQLHDGTRTPDGFGSLLILQLIICSCWLGFRLTLVAVKTHDVYLINFLSNFPRFVAWDLGEDQEKGASLPPWPITLALGTKTIGNMLQRILSSGPNPRGRLEEGLGEAEGLFT